MSLRVDSFIVLKLPANQKENCGGNGKEDRDSQEVKRHIALICSYTAQACQEEINGQHDKAKVSPGLFLEGEEDSCRDGDQPANTKEIILETGVVEEPLDIDSIQNQIHSQHTKTESARHIFLEEE